MPKLEINIYVGLEPGEQPTLGHVRQWLSEVDKFNLPDSHPLYALSIELTTFVNPQKVTPILCADCSPDQSNNDVLISTHECQS